MKKEVGVWIDHKKAIIVTGDGGTVEILELSKEDKLRFNGGTHGKVHSGAQVFLAEDQRDRRHLEHLHKYYAEVISHLREVDAILIFGPGEAKFELEKQLKQTGLEEKLSGLETTDKMTNRQLAAKVKQFFARQMLSVA